MSLTKALCCASSMLVLVAAAGAAQAQQAEKQVEEVVVTGTSIRGVAPVGAPVIQISSEEIKKTGTSNNVDLLRLLPQVVNIGADEARSGSGANTATANTYRASGINIRALGTQAVLNLVDGHRPAPAGIQVAFFDPASIPSIAISGVEVVPDGASAIYGADAISGVVNFILRKNFDGAEVSARYGFASGYKNTQLSAILGKTWQGGSAMLAVESTKRPEFYASERPDLFIGSDTVTVTRPSTATVPAYYLTNAFPPTITAGGVVYAAPVNSTSTPLTAAQVLAGQGQRNLTSSWAGNTIVPNQERKSVIANFNQQFTDLVKVYGQGFYTRRDFDHLFTSASTSNLTIRNTNPYAAFLAGLPGAPTSATVAYNFQGAFGPNYYEGYEEEAQVQIGARVNLPRDFQADVSVAQNYSHDRRLAPNGINTCAVTGVATNVSGPCTVVGGAIGQTSLATAFNPFGVNSDSVLKLLKGFTRQQFQVQLFEFNAKVDGTLMELPGGALKIAVGGDLLHQKDWFNNYTNATTADNSIIRQTSGNTKLQDIKAGFVEAVIPLIGSGNATPWAKSLQLSVAGRIDKYSIYSDATKNPKVGITWEPNDDVKVRGSYSTSFRSGLKDIDPNNAPNVTARINQYFDYSCNCQVTSLNRQGGNPNVRPETSRTITLGVDYRPHAIPGLDLNATYFKISYNNIIDMPGNNVNTGITSAAQEALYKAYLTRRPAASDTAGTAAFNALAQSLLGSPFFTGTAPASVAAVTIITSGQSFNAGSLRTTGIDFTALYNRATDIGDFSVGLVGTYYLTFDRSLTPFDTLSDKLDLIDFPTHYRLRGQLSWQRNGFRVTGFVNYIPKYSNTNVTPAVDVKPTTTVDLNASYTLEKAPFSVLDNVTLAITAQNLFDTQPPFALISQNQTYDSQTSSPFGRIVSVQLTKKF